MAADPIARVLRLPLSQLGRRLVLAEVLGQPVSKRLGRLGRPPRHPPADDKDSKPSKAPAKG